MRMIDLDSNWNLNSCPSYWSERVKEFQNEVKRSQVKTKPKLPAASQIRPPKIASNSWPASMELLSIATGSQAGAKLAFAEQLPEERTSRREKWNKKKQKHLPSWKYKNKPLSLKSLALLLIVFCLGPALSLDLEQQATTTARSLAAVTSENPTTSRANDDNSTSANFGIERGHVRRETNNYENGLVDEESPAEQHQQPTTQEPSDSSQIPGSSEQPVGAPAGLEVSRRPEATAPGNRKQAAQRPAAGARRNAVHRVSDSELLPLSDFNVHQPPFSELIKSWPPTSLQQLNREQSQGSLPAARPRQQQQQAAAGPGSSGAKSRLSSLLWGSGGASGDEEPEMGARNHLNEDFDDTLVTADESFERDQLEEPSTWVNYLGELGDYIYSQLRQHFLSASSSEQSTNKSGGQQAASKLELIDELLDDYYYDQYENSQVLYYGPQLVREGDIFEIGCYLPNDQPAEWTKSGRALEEGNRWPRIIRRSDFLGAKQNFSLKVFEASLSDRGNYRCNRMSRKFHKLVVVPADISSVQLFLVQQQLLSVVKPDQVSLPSATLSALTAASYAGGGGGKSLPVQQRQRKPSGSSRIANAVRPRLPPGQLIVENQPLTLDCNITDEFVLRRLRENPHFRLAWFKNGRQLRASQASNSGSNSNLEPGGGWPPGRQQPNSNNGINRRKAGQLQQTGSGSRPAGRIQFGGLNGRQLQISSAQFADAADYLCSWYQMPALNREPAGEEAESLAGEADLAERTTTTSFGGEPALPGQPAANPLAAGNLLQLMAPVKLRPFKSTYHVRENNELRLVCLARGAHPAAQISWYVGNRLVDGEFLRQHSEEFRVFSVNGEGQFSSFSSAPLSSGTSSEAETGSGSGSEEEATRRQIVEINPIPSNKQQLHLTADGRGAWLEFKELTNERSQINSPEQQQRYLQLKLAQLTSLPGSSGLAYQSSDGANSGANLPANAGEATPAAGSGRGSSKTSLSILVINKLNVERHSARFACRATSRANTDEVSTVIKVQGSSVVVVRPSSGRASLVYGQPLHFQCEFVGQKNVNFLWYKRRIGHEPGDYEYPVLPDDDGIELHNDRLTVLAPSRKDVADYVCRLKNEKLASASEKEFAVIKVRSAPYIEDFNLETSGKSYTLSDGERLELLCRVREQTAPVNITWLKSQTPDDESKMVAISATKLTGYSSPNSSQSILQPQTFLAPDQSSILVEQVDEFSKRLVIESVKLEHRSYYVCMADNGVTERTRKVIFVRVKDKFIALWPFLGIVSEVFILFTIIHSWETFSMYQRVPTRSVTFLPSPLETPGSI